ncbi:Uncharacterised protein [Kluyvera cryocrescens]|uniref:Uncharacterized protein n=1 Tax=Kluyvera cryocrescens TaxID=580 RepID=A0A485AQR9_KLUCR|nr:Uncharacterised protein [Kluyvera cryocrescens]
MFPSDNFTVRDNHNFAINGTHGRGENLHAQHRPCDATQVHILTGTEWTEHNQQHARSQVGKRPL